MAIIDRYRKRNRIYNKRFSTLPIIKSVLVGKLIRLCNIKLLKAEINLSQLLWEMCYRI